MRRPLLLAILALATVASSGCCRCGRWWGGCDGLFGNGRLFGGGVLRAGYPTGDCCDACGPCDSCAPCGPCESCGPCGGTCGSCGGACGSCGGACGIVQPGAAIEGYTIPPTIVPGGEMQIVPAPQPTPQGSTGTGTGSGT